MVELIMKNFFLFLSKNKVLKKSASRWGFKMGASQVVAGETIESAIATIKNLNDKGLACTVDHLGEFVYSNEEAIESANYCIKTLDAISESGVNCNLSLKMTSLGLDISKELCLENMRRILDTAKKTNNFVRIDMEDFDHCQITLDIFNELYKEYGSHIGAAIQAYLFRAKEDIDNLKGVNLRLMKGAYKESPEVAYQDKKEVDRNYVAIIKQHLLNGSYTAIASHDHNVIAKIKEFCKENEISRDQFEFQMLYGFRTDLQEEIAKEGYKMRIYVPYGNDWYGYFMRRLAERPQNITFALRGFFSK
ncbi:proline dehydrogenase [Bacillaceae bacterium IKA-2]|nr:proline dehydrogenase [Bacillaceae bacterium IKA-2]